MAWNVLAGRVRVLLNSDPSEFTRGQRQARREAARTRREMARVRRQFLSTANAAARFARNLGLVVAPIVLLAGASGFSRLTLRTAAWADELQNLTRRTNLSAESLQGYAELLNGTRFELRDFGNVLATIAERLVEFQRGGSTAIEGFADIGIAAADLRGGLLGVESALILIIERYRELSRTSPTRALAGLQALLGDDAELISSLVERFGPDVQGAAQAAFAQSGGLTSQQVRELAEVNASVQRVTGAIASGLRQVIANNSTEINKLISSIENALPSLVESATNSTNQILDDINENFQRVQGTLQGVFQWLTTDLAKILQTMVDLLRLTFIATVVTVLLTAVRTVSALITDSIRFIRGVFRIFQSEGGLSGGGGLLGQLGRARNRSALFGVESVLTALGSAGIIVLFWDEIRDAFRIIREGAINVSRLFGSLQDAVNDNIENVLDGDRLLNAIGLGDTNEAVSDATESVSRFTRNVLLASQSLQEIFNVDREALGVENALAPLSDFERERQETINRALENLDTTEGDLEGAINTLNATIARLRESIDGLRDRVTEPVPPQAVPPPFEEGPGVQTPEPSFRDQLSAFFRLPRSLGEAFDQLIRPITRLGDAINNAILAIGAFIIPPAAAQGEVPFETVSVTEQLEEIQGVLEEIRDAEIQRGQAVQDLTGIDRLRRIVIGQLEADPTIEGEVELENAINALDAELRIKYGRLTIQREVNLELDRGAGFAAFIRQVDGFFAGIGDDLIRRSLDFAVAGASNVNRFIALTRNSLRELIGSQRQQLTSALEDAQRTLEFAERAVELNLPGSGQAVIEATENLRSAEQALADFNSRVDEGLPMWNDAINRFAEWSNTLDLADRFRQIGDAIESNLETAIENVIIDGQSLTDAFKNFVQEIIAEILRIAVIRPLASAIAGGISAGVGSLFGAPAFARGGFAQPGLAVVGELGPELVDFRSPGRVYTSQELANAIGSRGGGVGDISFNIQSSDGPGVRAAIQQSLPAIVAAANGEIYQAAGDRNSSFAQQIRERAGE